MNFCTIKRYVGKYESLIPLAVIVAALVVMKFLDDGLVGVWHIFTVLSFILLIFINFLILGFVFRALSVTRKILVVTLLVEVSCLLNALAWGGVKGFLAFLLIPMLMSLVLVALKKL